MSSRPARRTGDAGETMSGALCVRDSATRVIQNLSVMRRADCAAELVDEVRLVSSALRALMYRTSFPDS